MQDVLVVHCHHSHDQVGQCAQNLVCGEARAGLNTSLNQLIKVTVRAVLHNDKDGIAVAKVFMELDNGRALQHLEEGDLAVRCLSILSVHIVCVNRF